MKTIKCHTDLVMLPSAIAGKSYVIQWDDSKEIIIKNEQGENHSFSKDPNDDAYFGRWFNWFDLEDE